MRSAKKSQPFIGHKGCNFYLASSAKGIVFVGSQNKPFEELAEWARKRSPLYQ